MKRVFQISFAIVYLFLTTGFTITAHYCGGIVSDVSVVRTYGDKDPCGCEDSCDDSCCQDEVHTIKIADSHKFETKFNQTSFELIITGSDSGIFLTHDFNVNFISNNITYNDSSPPDLYINNCSFLI